LEIVVEQSGTVDSTGAASGGTDDGNLLLWVQRMISEGICPTIDPKILAFLSHKEKITRRNSSERSILFVFYESIKRELQIKPI
jgi:hypothetical protein